jgi:hypothetical protein
VVRGQLSIVVDKRSEYRLQAGLVVVLQEVIDHGPLAGEAMSRLCFTEEELNEMARALERLPYRTRSLLVNEIEKDPWLLIVFKPYLLGESVVQ